MHETYRPEDNLAGTFIVHYRFITLPGNITLGVSVDQQDPRWVRGSTGAIISLLGLALVVVATLNYRSKNRRKTNTTVEDSLRKLDEEAKLQHEYLESLNPVERRALIIQMRDVQSKNAQQSIIVLGIIGLLFSAGTAYLWLIQYRMNLMSSSGIIGGLILAIFGFRYVQANRITLNSKIQSDNFIDDDIIAYFREHEEINQKALEQWNKKGKYIVSVFGGVLILLAMFHPTMPFVLTLLASGISNSMVLSITITGFTICSSPLH